MIPKLDPNSKKNPFKNARKSTSNSFLIFSDINAVFISDSNAIFTLPVCATYLCQISLPANIKITPFTYPSAAKINSI